ncbi:hypothetical protein HCN44_002804 [Aphidius gifuensis]|uniref:Uncharacterized protein n=1 Tax=Aphidius gifuensis TaxID=684658 RepID=A0A834XRK1_APHGI|nr:uncharacterized protein LOC122854362 [Aphidius gifuensis]KAF7991242.1 hypothetical protein HCN44_002804 [Aphidius gifuensis]
MSWACFGQCFANVTKSFTHRYSRYTGSCQEDEQVDSEQTRNGCNLLLSSSPKSKKSKKNLLSFLPSKYFKRKNQIPISLELAEDNLWSRRGNKYFRLDSSNNASMSSNLNTPLQPLDARILLKHECVSSTTASSIDLEWEHEVLPIRFVDNENQINTNNSSKTSSKGSQPSSLTASPWSRVSTPNSLEWDSIDHDNEFIDAETEQLLTEIDRLKNKTLNETGAR